jgi:hypothetical protein
VPTTRSSKPSPSTSPAFASVCPKRSSVVGNVVDQRSGIVVDADYAPHAGDTPGATGGSLHASQVANHHINAV